MKKRGIGTAAMNFAIHNIQSPGLYCGMQNPMEPGHRHININNAWRESLALKTVYQNWHIGRLSRESL